MFADKSKKCIPKSTIFLVVIPLNILDCNHIVEGFFQKHCTLNNLHDFESTQEQVAGRVFYVMIEFDRKVKSQLSER